MVSEEDQRRQQAGRRRSIRRRRRRRRRRAESASRTRQIGRNHNQETCGALNGERLEPLFANLSECCHYLPAPDSRLSGCSEAEEEETRSRKLCSSGGCCCCRCWQLLSNNDKPRTRGDGSSSDKGISSSRLVIKVVERSGALAALAPAPAINRRHQALIGARQSTPHQTPTPSSPPLASASKRRDLINFRWPLAPSLSSSSLPCSNQLLVLIHLVCLFALAASGGQRWARQADNRPSAQQLHNVPYKKFYVTRACEWKSNLFVPKSNDIHFAQPAAAQTASGASGQYQAGGDQPLQSQEQRAGFAAGATNGNQWEGNSRTLLSTESKALILALPIKMSQSFAGYEPACSIRLIVPRNMRILAQLTSRKLTFAQQQQVSEFSLDDSLPLALDQLALDGAQQGQQQQQQAQSLWLNVSLNPFIETEQRTIESEGNVLAFRFLLERFAARQYPDTRFQVVLTAFQTLSENSDLSGAGQVPPSMQPNMDSSAQFICDQQRLISTDLACDGFKNCQDGHDEEPTTCLALRATEQVPPTDQQAEVPHVTYEAPTATHQQEAEPGAWARLWHFLRDTHSLAGFFLGFLLVLVLLTCCTCCAYIGYLLVWRRQCEDLLVYVRDSWRDARRQDVVGGRRADEQEAAGLAAAQNIENSMRLKHQFGRQSPAQLKTGMAADNLGQPQPPPRLQSILKKPPTSGVRPVEPPPMVPTRPARGAPSSDTLRRGALSSSLIRSRQVPDQLPTQIFRPTPAKRVTRPPTRPVPVPASIHSATTPTSETIVPLSSSTTSKTTITRSTGTQRITTYHYSAGTTRFSEAYLERLAEQQQHRQSELDSSASMAPTGQPANVNYRRDLSDSPQSSLI